MSVAVELDGLAATRGESEREEVAERTAKRGWEVEGKHDDPERLVRRAKEPRRELPPRMSSGRYGICGNFRSGSVRKGEEAEQRTL